MAPGPRLQQINARLHEEPLASIVYFIFWLTILCGVVPPVAAIVLPARCLYHLVLWWFGWGGDNDYDPAKISDIELAVVITGCDTGFGKELALWAGEAGYVVFAGCLEKESFDQFEVKGSLITPLALDVTSDTDVAAAATQVSRWINNPEKKGKKRVLHALVNNAGIGHTSPFDWLELSDYQRVMDGKCTAITTGSTGSTGSISRL
jgi:hypothetical protein